MKLKLKSATLCILIFAFMIGLGLISIPQTKAKNTVNAAVGDMDVSMFTFVATSSTECNVRLTDKTVSRAIVPTTALINNVEYKVTSVAANGFANSLNLEKVWLPHTIKTISSAAFMNCGNLASITLPAVETINANAFAITNLEYLIIPESTTYVAATILRNNSTQVYVRATEAQVALYNWTPTWNGNNSITNVEYASNFTPEIQYRYEEIVIPTQLRASFAPTTATLEGYIVDNYQPFVTQSGVDVYIPAVYEGLPVIGIADYAFMFNEINSITIAYSEEPIRIGEYAFYYLTGNTVTINRDIVFESDYGTTSEFVFASSSLSTVILPNTITEFGNSAFQECFGLTDVHFIEPQPLTQTLEENILNTLASTQIVSLPETVTTLGSDVFSSVSNVMELHVPNTVVNVGSSAFVGWTVPQTIYIDYENEQALGNGWSEFWSSGCDLSIIEYAVPQVFNISYNLDGGTHFDNPETYTPKESVTFNDATKTGYIFNGWHDEQGNLVESISVGTVGDKVLTAYWTAIKYDIVYDSNKPTTASGTITGATGNSTHTYDAISSLTPNGYSLVGWVFSGWKNSNGEIFIDGNSVLNWTTESDTITLLAQWTPLNYTITYHDNRPGTASNPVNGNMDNTMHTYDQGSALRSNNYTLYGWTFNGWQDAARNSYSNGQSVTTVSNGGMVTLFAQWSPITYEVFYNANGGTGTISSSFHTFDMPSQLNSNVFTRTGYRFNGWRDSNGNAYYDNEPMTTTLRNGTVTISAQWLANTYTVVYHGNWATGGSMDNSTHTYDVASNLRANGFENVYTSYMIGSCYDKFLGWALSENGSVVYSDKQNVVNLTSVNGGIVNLYAQWEPGAFALEIYTSTDGSSFVSRETVYFDTDFTLVAPSKKNYTFELWGAEVPVYGSGFSVIYDSSESATWTININYQDIKDSTRYAANNYKPRAMMFTAYYTKNDECVAEGTQITLADGTQKTVEDLDGTEMLLVWNMMTGSFDVAPILFIDRDPVAEYEIIHLYFSDGTEVKIIDEHAFWDFNLNEYVFLRDDASQYIGHWYNKQTTNPDGSLSWGRVQLVDVQVYTEINTAHSPVTYSHLCYYVNGMLSMPGATEGLMNIFEVDANTLQIDQAQYLADIQEYGLFTYDEFAALISETIFDAFNVQYLKVSLGKGLIDWERIEFLIERYSALM